MYPVKEMVPVQGCAALNGSNGPGNFRNLFLYSPNGKKHGVQFISVSEVAAKDDFFNIKSREPRRRAGGASQPAARRTPVEPC